MGDRASNKEPVQEQPSVSESPWLDRAPKPQDKSDKPVPTAEHKPSKFAWLEQQKQKTPEERNRFERSEEGRKNAQDKDQDKDDRSR